MTSKKQWGKSQKEFIFRKRKCHYMPLQSNIQHFETERSSIHKEEITANGERDVYLNVLLSLVISSWEQGNHHYF